MHIRTKILIVELKRNSLLEPMLRLATYLTVFIKNDNGKKSVQGGLHVSATGTWRKRTTVE